ncbi:Sapep family Mn(2+)-dependent dipeptidase [uncultured Olegusella sp.]|uniref:Sapep family Mn(2+)-dependent dipeptidase n=1 Tax=uncultured Olegusella sp. TaxID=1979846 RepID=UPI0026302A28|nr:Sapep family Mn(2+)-dependent dipeptidase [uncultured Olegusella sp.]
MIDEQFKQNVDAFVDEVWEDVVADIRRLVRIRSVEDCAAAKPGMPWGPASHEALVVGLRIADRLGLDAHECEGYLGYADLAGESDKQIATIAHTDVVPEGLGWTFPPFDVSRKEGCLVGRGVLDDKGPCVLSLYAAHYFVREAQRSGKKLPYTLRCIVGNNEETSMKDLDWYLERYPMPEFVFSPDAEFPLICGEKGLYSGTFCSGKIAGDVIVELDGGTVGNAIPGRATAVIKCAAAELPEANSIDIEAAGDSQALITAHGKGGHASMPAGTVNAIALLVDYLLEHKLCSAKERVFLEMERILLATTDGSSVGVASKDDKFGPLTLIGGTVRTENGRFIQTVDSRFPTSTTGERISETLSSFGAQYGCSYAEGRNVTPFYVSPELPEIRCLLDTYEEYSGREGKAFTIGGGTYARHFARGAAFGPWDPTDSIPEWAGPEHGPNEAIPEASLKRALKIYIMSIARLMELDF